MVNDGYETPKDMSDMPKPGEPGNMQEPRKSATIVTTTGGGTFHSADCPYCGKSTILGRELSILQVGCKECHKTYDLRYPKTNEFLSEMRGKEVPFRLQDDESKRPGGKPTDKYGREFCSECGASLAANGECTKYVHNKNDGPLQDSLRVTPAPKKDDGSNTPFNPPPAKPLMPDYPHGDPRRGPLNWPMHYGGRH